jgi:hypothetical protein
MYLGYLLTAPAGVPFTYLWWIQKITDDLVNEAIWFNEFTGALFYAGMLPSLWLWLYVISVMLTRGIRRAQPNIDDAPFRSIGVIAAALTFVIVGISSVL